MEKKLFLINNISCKEVHGKNRCKKCNLIFINNILCFLNYEQKDFKVEQANVKLSYSSWKKDNFLKVYNYLKNKENLKILDIGSGRNLIEIIYPDLKKNLFIHLDIAPRLYVDIIADFEKEIYFDGCFDVLICLNVLEHVFNFHEFIKNMSRVIKPKGKLLLSIPYNSGLHYLPHDYFRMSHYALKRLLNDNNFEVIKIEPFYQNRIDKILKDIKLSLADKSLTAKMLKIIIIFLIRVYNKLFKNHINPILIDDAEKKFSKLYTEPLGYFLEATRK